MARQRLVQVERGLRGWALAINLCQRNAEQVKAILP